MSKHDVLLMIHNFNKLKILTKNAKIRSLLTFILICGISFQFYIFITTVVFRS